MGMLNGIRTASAAQAAVLEVAAPPGSGRKVPAKAAPCQQKLQPAGLAAGGIKLEAGDDKPRRLGQGGVRPRYQAW